MVGKQSITNPTAWRAAFDLARVVQSSGTIYASSDVMFKFAFFGRDSMEVAEDLLLVDPTVARRLLPKLARLQGTVHNPVTEEEPGKIHHEHRELVVDGQKIPRKSKKILTDLAGRWGLDAAAFTYYGAVDTTPLFARLLSRYALGVDPSILQQTVINKQGHTVTMAESLQMAMDCIQSQINRSQNGLLEFLRQNKNGHLCQVWKDSVTALQHADGTAANYHKPVATVDLQAMAYDALWLGSKALSLTNAAAPERIETWQHAAEALRKKTLSVYWLQAEQRFATGSDYGPHGELRLITTPSSNQGVVLYSNLLLGINEADREKYVSGTIRSIFSDDFITEVGIRCRSLAYRNTVNYDDYHGSMAVWPKETYDIAKGLRLHGLEAAAQNIERRILKGTNRGGNRELFFVAPDGTIAWRLLPYNRLNRRLPISSGRVIRCPNVPESSQAWTSSAVFAIKMHHRNQQPLLNGNNSGLLGLEKELVAKYHTMGINATLDMVIDAIPTLEDLFFIDVKTGLQRQLQWEQQFINDPWLSDEMLNR